MLLASHAGPGYDIMLFLHILTAFAAFAPLFVHPILTRQITESDPGAGAGTLGFLAQNSRSIYASSLVVSGLLGFGVAGMSDGVFSMSQGWLVTAFIVWVAMNGVLHAMIIPSEKAVAVAGAARDAAAEKKLQTGGIIFTLLFVVQLYVMVAKPGL